MTPISTNTTTSDAAWQPRRHRSRRTVAVLLVLAILAGSGVWYGWLSSPADDLKRFQGEWKLTDARQPPAGPDEVRVGVRVAGDTWQYVAAGRDGKAFRLRLNEGTTPKQIELELLDAAGLKGPPVRLHGVYQFDGPDRVRVRVRAANEPRPESLDDPEATDWVLTRARLPRQAAHD